MNARAQARHILSNYEARELEDAITDAIQDTERAAYEAAAQIVETKSVPLGHERRYFARAIRQYAQDQAGPSPL